MDNESLGDIERRLTSVSSSHAPTELRAAVLRDMHRELAAARWDRRLARAAVVLLAIGVGMNLAMGLQSSGSSSVIRQIAGGSSRDSLMQVAVTVSEATDAQTGRQFARQMAAMSGVPLSSEQSAAIDAAVKRHARPAASDGKDG